MARKAAAISLTAILLIGAFGSVGADAKKKKKKKDKVDVTLEYAATETGAVFSGLVSSGGSKGCATTAEVNLFIEAGTTDALIATARAEEDDPAPWATSFPASPPSGTVLYAKVDGNKVCKEGVSPLLTIP